VLVPQPTFSEYARAAEAAGAQVILCPLSPTQGFRLDVEAYCRLLEQADMAFLCNPNNPTGNLFPYDTLYHIWQESRRRGVWLIVDESFLDFVENWPELSLVQVAAREEKLIILRSLTKFFALPGLRLGAGIAAPSIIKYLEERSDPWRVNILAQLAGAIALKDKEFQERTRKWLKAEKAYLFEGLASLPGFRPYSSEANFILVDINLTGWNSGELVEALAQYKVLVRDCSNFPGLNKGGYIRVAVKEREANAVLLKLLKNFLQVKGG
jgi:threonine-phosphate decarboxylase